MCGCMAYESEGRVCMDLGMTAALRAQKPEATVQLPNRPLLTLPGSCAGPFVVSLCAFAVER